MITGHPPFPFFCAGLTVSPSLLLKKRLKLPKGEWLESQLIEIFRSQVPEVVEAICPEPKRQFLKGVSRPSKYSEKAG